MEKSTIIAGFQKNKIMQHFVSFALSEIEPAPAESLRLRGGRNIEYGGNSYQIGKAQTSTRQGKKYQVDVADKTNGTTKTVHWGAKGYDDFYVHKDKARRDNFRKRASAIKTKDGQIASDDPTRPAYHALNHSW